jgi:hypothetical protein
MPNNSLDRYKRGPNKTGADQSDWNGPQGSSDLGRDGIRRDDSGLGYPKPKDISKVVDEAHKIDGGFSGRLPNND